MDYIDLCDPDLAEDIYDFCMLPEFYQEFCDMREEDSISMAEFLDNYHATDFAIFLVKKYA